MGEHTQQVQWSRVALLREPAIPLLCLASAVMVARGYAADILLCAGTLAFMLAEAPRWCGRIADATPPRLGAAARFRGCIAAVVLAVAIARIPGDSRWLDAALAAVGVLALRLALVGPGGHDERDDRDGREGRDGRDGIVREVRAAVKPERASERAMAPEPGHEPASGVARRLIRGVDPPAPPRWWVWLALGLTLLLVELGSFLSQPDARTDDPHHPTVSTLVEPWLTGGAPRAAALTLWLLAGWWLVRRIRAWVSAP